MNTKPFNLINDSPGITDVPGFETAGISSDVRGNNEDRLDTALLFSQYPATAAGVFTQNDVVAAPVSICRNHLKSGHTFHAVIANSGNANACTGKRGIEDAVTMIRETAKSLEIPPHSVLVCSTGRIGEHLPMNRLIPGIKQAVQEKSNSEISGQAAAKAILTSDTKPKTVTLKIPVPGGEITIAGMAKGSGMIEPNMATMLGFLATDAKIESGLLDKLLHQAINVSFNCISIDGDMSTNDTVLLMANGASGIEINEASKTVLQRFSDALTAVCINLAHKIVSDGERITKVVTVNVMGAPTREAAEKVARAIGNSLLVKASWYGSDPNWGRLLDAAGYARIGLKEEKLDLQYNNIEVIHQGDQVPENKAIWKSALANRNFSINMNLNLGDGKFTLLTTDLSEGYVNFNKSE